MYVIQKDDADANEEEEKEEDKKKLSIDIEQRFAFFLLLLPVLLASLFNARPCIIQQTIDLDVVDYRMREEGEKKMKTKEKKKTNKKSILSPQRWATIDWAETQFSIIRSLSMTSFLSWSIDEDISNGVNYLIDTHMFKKIFHY